MVAAKVGAAAVGDGDGWRNDDDDDGGGWLLLEEVTVVLVMAAVVMFGGGCYGGLRWGRLAGKREAVCGE
ncbi:hypothetical protein Tco_0790380 [Tanacetum coccineum]